MLEKRRSAPWGLKEWRRPMANRGDKERVTEFGVRTIVLQSTRACASLVLYLMDTLPSYTLPECAVWWESCLHEYTSAPKQPSYQAPEMKPSLLFHWISERKQSNGIAWKTIHKSQEILYASRFHIDTASKVDPWAVEAHQSWA